jgi:O-methyltransferase
MAGMQTDAYSDLLGIAFDHQHSRRYPEAEATFRKMLDAKPSDEFVNDALIFMLFAQDRSAEAIAAYDAAIQCGLFPCDRGFDEIYRRALVTTHSCPAPLKRRLRFMSLLELLSRALSLRGETVECGCFRGLSSHLMCTRLRQHNPSFAGKTYHIFDSFQGLSAPTLEDEIPPDFPNADSLQFMTVKGHFAASLAEVKRNLGEFPEIAFHVGWIPFCFDDAPETRYRFVHLDVDLYDPTLESLEYFLPRMVSGGLIVSDDYSWPGAQRAIDEFCAERGIAFSVTEQKQAVIVAA